jgi:hypothetical protein
MIARRLTLTTVAVLCALVCVLVSSTSPAAATAQFGSEGSGSGLFDGPSGIALDGTGDVYVSDQRNHRIDKFDGSGSFLMAWGWDVNEESPATELQTCTVACQGGASGMFAGQYASEGPQAVVVDREPFSGSYGDVYVADWDNRRVEKFDPSGKFLLMFGGGVNETSGGDVCVAGEKCTRGTEGTASGQIAWAYRADGYLAVGPGGAVYVGDQARVQVFEPSGVWRESISLAGLSSTGKVTALAVDASGDMFVKDSEASGVREFERDGTEKPTQFDAGSESVEAITLDGSGDLFVADSTGGFHVLKYDPAGKELASFGSKTAAGANGMAFSDALDELYVSTQAAEENSVWILSQPPPGPLVEPGSESATPGQRGTATLEASVDPEGGETTYHFEYVDDAHYRASGYASASSTPPTSIGSSFDDQSAIVALTGLVPGGTYHYRIVATSSQGTTNGADQVLVTVPPAQVEGPWVADVAGTSATFQARIDPLGVSTDYRLEYGTTMSYGHTLSGSVDEGDIYVLVSYHSQDLQPETTYHYRVVATNEVGTYESTDHTFTTEAGSDELILPDERTWELVSPANKRGAAIEPFENGGEIQAASDGSAITYIANEPVGANPRGYTERDQVLSARGAHGWSSESLSIPVSPEPEKEIILGKSELEYSFFAPDLSSALVQPQEVFNPLAPEATEWTLYRRNDADGSYLPLLTPADVTPGVSFGEKPGNGGKEGYPQEVLASTPDLNHVVFESHQALTAGAINNHNELAGGTNLYEWSAAGLQLVNVLPDGASESGEAFLGGNGVADIGGMLVHALSDDGRWVVWRTGIPQHNGGIVHLYARDMVDKKTIRVGGQYPSFQTMSSDGSRILYMEDGELYDFSTSSDAKTDITANHLGGERSAGVMETVSTVDASEDGSYVYFVATGVLADGAVGGQDNLYMAHDENGEWTTRYVATLSIEDEHDWASGDFGEHEFNFGGVELARVSSRVSPDGRYLAFMSSRSLTGYDNIDAVSGQPDEEVYLYDASSDHLTCASCDPTGARPVGVHDSTKESEKLLTSNQTQWPGHWLAGSVPGWRRVNERELHQPRYLSDSGRLFFESPDALVPQDTNGLEDVYEYEPAGVGGCETTGVTFSDRSDGCVDLISSGISAGESAFFDASENGDDVFFVTSDRLTAADYDTNIDVYDAHVCSSTVPCAVVPVSPPPCTSGDSCKAAPSPQPEIFGSTPSATFSGVGNVDGSPSKPSVSRRSSTRAQKLARALRACHRKKARKSRVACERQARKRYPAEQSGKAKATRKGNR